MKTLKLNLLIVIGITLLTTFTFLKASLAGNGNELTYPQVKLDLTVMYLYEATGRKINLRLNNAFVQLINKKGSVGLIEFYKTDANGNVLVLMKPNSTYELQVSKGDLQSKKIKITVGDISESTTYNEVIYIKDIKQKGFTKN